MDPESSCARVGDLFAPGRLCRGKSAATIRALDLVVMFRRVCRTWSCGGESLCAEACVARSARRTWRYRCAPNHGRGAWTGWTVRWRELQRAPYLRLEQCGYRQGCTARAGRAISIRLGVARLGIARRSRDRRDVR